VTLSVVGFAIRQSSRHKRDLQNGMARELSFAFAPFSAFPAILFESPTSHNLTIGIQPQRYEIGQVSTAASANPSVNEHPPNGS
jgi:hypothetical protein